MAHSEICLVCKGSGRVPSNVTATAPVLWECHGCGGKGRVTVPDLDRGRFVPLVSSDDPDAYNLTPPFRTTCVRYGPLGESVELVFLAHDDKGNIPVDKSEWNGGYKDGSFGGPPFEVYM